MCLRRILLSCAVLFGVTPSLRAEYVALRNGQRLHVTGYQLLGEKYRLQIAGGIVEVPVEEVMAIEPEDLFAPLPAPVAATAPFHEMVKAAAARFGVQNIFDPQENIDAGTHYLSDLLRRYDNDLVLALAAYNAGAERVREWQGQGTYRDPQEFVESIPFTETREYVQAILRNANVYRQLYGEP